MADEGVTIRLRLLPRIKVCPCMAAMLAFCFFGQAGCGLVFHGRTQQVTLKSVPPGARALVDDQSLTETPGDVAVSRRHREHVLRASKPGYRSACHLLACGFDKIFVAADSIPAAIPLLIDLTAGTLSNCPSMASVTLQPLKEGESDQPLPSDTEIIAAYQRSGADLCVLALAERVMLINGDLNRPYQILGSIQVEDSDFRKFHLEKSPANLERVLRQKALAAYGDKVDALINVSDEFSQGPLRWRWTTGFLHQPEDVAFARGLAVHFTDQWPADIRPKAENTAPAQRLESLKELLDKGLISPAEYEKKRADVLQGL